MLYKGGMANANKHHSEPAMGTNKYPLYSATMSLSAEILVRMAFEEWWKWQLLEE